MYCVFLNVESYLKLFLYLSRVLDLIMPTFFLLLLNHPVIAKTFEVPIVNNQLIRYFEENVLLTEDQFGFRPKRGTIGAKSLVLRRTVYLVWILKKLGYW